MNGHGEHIVAVIKDRLGAVAVVHIPINDREPSGRTFGPCGFDRDRDIGKHAETVGMVRQCMMTRRPGQRIGILEVSVQY